MANSTIKRPLQLKTYTVSVTTEANQFVTPFTHLATIQYSSLPSEINRNSIVDVALDPTSAGTYNLQGTYIAIFQQGARTFNVLIKYIVGGG